MILQLREKLVADGVELMVLESTSDYGRPFFYVLSEQLDVMLVKAFDVRAMPGGKSDVSDAEWLADLAAHGLVRASVMPPEDIRQLRDLTRSRTVLVAERTWEAQRLEKELEDACIKLSAVVTKISRRLCPDDGEALVNAETEPAVMAELAQGRMRNKIDRLREALTGRFNDHHRFMVTFGLQRIDQTNADIARLGRRIDELIAQHGTPPPGSLNLAPISSHLVGFLGLERRPSGLSRAVVRSVPRAGGRLEDQAWRCWRRRGCCRR